ncbi:MAG: cyclic pyranopterin monophosphate synthase MoaC [Litorivicinus sp.]
MTEFTHTNSAGDAHMVNVSQKVPTQRVAVAEGYLYANADVIAGIRKQTMSKGDVLAVARVAGILGAKKTPELIPLCHGLPLEQCSVELTVEDTRIRVEARCELHAKTGIEMEALSAVSIACLTLYDMCKAIDKAMRIEGIRLLSKTGGKSGDYYAEG